MLHQAINISFKFINRVCSGGAQYHWNESVAPLPLMSSSCSRHRYSEPRASLNIGIMSEQQYIIRFNDLKYEAPPGDNCTNVQLLLDAWSATLLSRMIGDSVSCEWYFCVIGRFSEIVWSHAAAVQTRMRLQPASKAKGATVDGPHDRIDQMMGLNERDKILSAVHSGILYCVVRIQL